MPRRALTKPVRSFVLLLILAVCALVITYSILRLHDYSRPTGYSVTSPPTPLRPPPWAAMVRTVTEACSCVANTTFVMDPRLLDLLAGGSTPETRGPGAWDRWAQGRLAVLTLGMVEPSDRFMFQMNAALIEKYTLSNAIIFGEDARNVSMTYFEAHPTLTLPRITLHYVWWMSDDVDTHPLIHVVIFRRRGDYWWHGALSGGVVSKATDDAMPFNVSALVTGRHARLLDRFATRKTEFGGVSLAVPVDVPSFRRQLRDRKFLECDHVTARAIYRDYDSGYTRPGDEGAALMEMLRMAAGALDPLGVSFWLGSGTLLGWYRHCDIIPYVVDADLEIRASDFSDEVTSALKKAGFIHLKTIGEVNDGQMLAFQHGVHSIDLFSVYEEDNYVWTGSVRSDLKKFRLKYPKYELSWAELRGVRVRVPADPELYLRSVYGPDWRTPVTKFNRSNVPNRKRHGQWPESKRDKVLQSYCCV